MSSYVWNAPRPPPEGVEATGFNSSSKVFQRTFTPGHLQWDAKCLEKTHEPNRCKWLQIIL